MDVCKDAGGRRINQIKLTDSRKIACTGEWHDGLKLLQDENYDSCHLKRTEL